MIPAAFEYHAATSLQQAVKLLRRYDGEARVLAGGMSLIPMMKLRLANLSAVIDLERIKGLSFINETADALTIGPMTTHYMLESSNVVRGRVPLLTETASAVGDLQVRNRGTIGGSVAQADPAADLPAALLALEATFRIAGGQRRRNVRAESLFIDSYTTSLEDNEIIVEIRIRTTGPNTGWSYQKLANRASRFAVVGVAALITVGQDGTCVRARIAITGAAPSPFRARHSERYLKGKSLTEVVIAAAAHRATRHVDFLNDIHGSSAYREHLTSELTIRAITQAKERAV